MSIETRMEQIRSELNGLGTESGQVYTNDEVIQRLVDLQAAMAKSVFALRHAEHFVAKDIMIHFSALAREYGLDECPEFRRLQANMKNLGFTIGSLKKGAYGERRASEGLRVLTFDPGVKILYNIALQDGMSKTEYDAIVITPYGIFVVEAKNFRGAAYITNKGMLQRQGDDIPTYNIGEKMNNKEFLLKNCLGEYAQIPYQGILLYVDESADLLDDFGQYPIKYCNTVASYIRQQNAGTDVLTSAQVNEIAELLLSHSVTLRYPCKVDCEQIKADFASVMSQIEATADEENENEPIDDKRDPEVEPLRPSTPEVSQVQANDDGFWKGTLVGVACLAFCLGTIKLIRIIL